MRVEIDESEDVSASVMTGVIKPSAVDTAPEGAAGRQAGVDHVELQVVGRQGGGFGVRLGTALLVVGCVVAAIPTMRTVVLPALALVVVVLALRDHSRTGMDL